MRDLISKICLIVSFSVLSSQLKREELDGFVFASGSGYLLFGQSGKNTRISKVNSQGIVPGCSSLVDTIQTVVKSYVAILTGIDLTRTKIG